MPSLNTCVKSLATIESFPPSCSAPSTLRPIHAVPKEVTFWIYGDLLAIQTLVSAGPHPASKLTYAPALGRLVPYALSLPNVPVKPVTVQFLIPDASLT